MLFYTMDGTWVDLDLFAFKNDTLYYKEVLRIKRPFIHSNKNQKQEPTFCIQKNLRTTLNNKIKINKENT